jgi:Protein of unknown function (DUF4242)
VPRYVVERRLPDSRRSGAPLLQAAVDDGVTWLHSYIGEETNRMFCVYEAPSPEAIRKTSSRNALPVERITQVRVLDPYFYVGLEARR